MKMFEADASWLLNADIAMLDRCAWGARLARLNGEDEKAQRYDELFERAWARIENAN